MVEYRDWAGEFIDAELDGGATASKRIVKKDGTMLEPDFDTVATAVQIGRCGYPSPC